MVPTRKVLYPELGNSFGLSVHCCNEAYGRRQRAFSFLKLSFARQVATSFYVRSIRDENS